jgi:hypothetical protein
MKRFNKAEFSEIRFVLTELKCVGIAMTLYWMGMDSGIYNSVYKWNALGKGTVKCTSEHALHMHCCCYLLGLGFLNLCFVLCGSGSGMEKKEQWIWLMGLLKFSNVWGVILICTHVLHYIL